MTRPGGRPRTFPRAVVPVALDLREREGWSWPEIARELKVQPGTLRSRVSDYRRALMHKTPETGLSETDLGSRTSEGEGV